MAQEGRQKRSTRRSEMVCWPVLKRIQVILRQEMVREFLAEFMSTYVMMVFGLGSVAQMVLGNNKFGSYLAVNLGFGFGVTMGVHVAGNISGAHMNAAVTFTSCALGRMPWKKFPVYVLGQFLGSFTAAATIYCLFLKAILHFSGGQLTVVGSTATAGIFATYLPNYMTLWWGFLNEVSGPSPHTLVSSVIKRIRILGGDFMKTKTLCLCAGIWGPTGTLALLGPWWAAVMSASQMLLTGMLQLCLFAITDKENNPALQGTQALVIGVLIVITGVSLGMNTGYAINPSRDLPPRFFTFIAGWGKEVFRDNWWWVPVVAPFLGAYLGGIVYLLFIGIPQNPQRLENSVVCEDHRITVLPKSSLCMTSPCTPVSAAPANIATVAQPAPPLSGSVPLEHF